MSQGVAPLVRARGQVRGRGRRGLRDRAWLAGAGVVALTALSGCTADPPAQTIQTDYTEPATPAPSASASAVAAAAPERPPEMERGDDVGAVAAATYFMRLFNYAYRSGDLTDWTAFGAADCQFCANVANEVEAASASGERYAGGALDLGEPALAGSDSSLGVVAVRVPFAIAEFDVYDAQGDRVRTVGAESGVAILEVLHGQQGWTLLGAAPEGAES